MTQTARTPVKAARATLLALGLGLLGAQAMADLVTFQTATGSMELPEPPQTIAVLDIAAIDTLSALGVEPDGIVTPLYTDFLEPQMEGVPSVGTIFEADFEKLAVLRPDLIIVGSRAAAQAEALRRLAPVADMTIGPDAFGDGEARLAAYGTIFDKQAEAAELQTQLDAALETTREAVADKGGRALILLANGPKISAFGRGSRFGWLHERLDWPQAVEGIQTSNHGEPVSFEYVAQADPDTLLVIDRGTTVGEGAQSAEATLDNALVHNTKAWQEGRVIYLSPPAAYVSAGGVQSLLFTLDEITKALTAGGS
ncbi:siderophore ABC transporter substrate-binding protein [Pseudooceanicola sp. HF7]|uniref:siderophore ABC transporter substrate-binding protein n=1 Tax=Pseudooceanicola sp. HF7 TaxID=2721560 RepID=UPI0014304549|nr:siderophore ABC transporter substrate-binding protein [Pseudooceanicola sp. HF7]NIZ08400.1 siderophore ABC transporter substrate-binding protein [Pseudooceanicola sp. HF7]